MPSMGTKVSASGGLASSRAQPGWTSSRNVEVFGDTSGTYFFGAVIASNVL